MVKAFNVISLTQLLKYITGIYLFYLTIIHLTVIYFI